MLEIKPLTHFDPDVAQRLISGYVSPAKYQVEKTETADRITIALQLVALPEPYIKQYEPLDDETLRKYQGLPEVGFSFGIYENDQAIGLALAEPQRWNNSLWVWEFHIRAGYRRQGLGRQLMTAVIDKARAAGIRTVQCETQNTNAPAIAFYRKMGFDLDGIDLSYYSNQDYPDGEIALFMKKHLS
jgi:ribosomal protein S18 acetylase RimI-like enzyme